MTKYAPFPSSSHFTDHEHMDHLDHQKMTVIEAEIHHCVNQTDVSKISIDGRKTEQVKQAEALQSSFGQDDFLIHLRTRIDLVFEGDTEAREELSNMLMSYQHLRDYITQSTYHEVHEFEELSAKAYHEFEQSVLLTLDNFDEWSRDKKYHVLFILDAIEADFLFFGQRELFIFYHDQRFIDLKEKFAIPFINDFNQFETLLQQPMQQSSHSLSIVERHTFLPNFLRNRMEELKKIKIIKRLSNVVAASVSIGVPIFLWMSTEPDQTFIYRTLSTFMLSAFTLFSFTPIMFFFNGFFIDCFSSTDDLDDPDQIGPKTIHRQTFTALDTQQKKFASVLEMFKQKIFYNEKNTYHYQTTHKSYQDKKKTTKLSGASNDLDRGQIDQKIDGYRIEMGKHLALIDPWLSPIEQHKNKHQERHIQIHSPTSVSSNS